MVNTKIMVFSTLVRNENKLLSFAEFSHQFFVFKAQPKRAVKIKDENNFFCQSNFGIKKDLLISFILLSSLSELSPWFFRWTQLQERMPFPRGFSFLGVLGNRGKAICHSSGTGETKTYSPGFGSGFGGDFGEHFISDLKSI